MACARGTEVTTETSRHEIERLLMKHGAEEFASGWKSEKAMINIVLNNLADLEKDWLKPKLKK